MDRYWFPSHLSELSIEECYELLERTPLGRVAYGTPAGTAVIPVNHMLVGQDLFISISPYGEIATQLQMHGPDAPLTYQIDEYEAYNQSGWSVLILGRASRVEASELPDPGTRPLPWAEGARTALVRIRPQRVTGRRLLPA